MKKQILILGMAAIAATANAQVVINEFMQSNIDCIIDDLNQFPDSWVELYNTGATAVNLGDYSLGDKDDPAAAWQLPGEMLAPGGYRLVYCDKEADGWHTPFRIDSGKGATLYLFKGSEIADQIPADLKKQPAPNVAYGRKTDGADKWGYQLEPSPGNANTGKTCSNKDVLGIPVFSVAGKVFRTGEKITVAISMPDGTPEGTQIRYTLDGSEPTGTSLLYNGELTITGTTVVRAKPFNDKYLSPRSAVQSYICFDREVKMPVISIVTDDNYLNGNELGILVDKVTFGDQPNYKYDWRRPMNFEVFDGDLNASCINQLGEARLSGQASRSNPLKSFAIYANKRFGEKRFSHEFFPEQRPGLTEYKSLMLRNAGNDFDYLFMRDAIIQCHMSKFIDIDWQAWQPSIIFINGEYKGMLNIRERSNEDNIYTNYNGLEDIDMVENYWGELKEGDINEWWAFQNFYAEHGHTYAEYDTRMDVSEYMDIMIMNLYYCNLDFPGNNMVFWKPQAEGGRWRVIVKDTDFGLGLYGRNVDYKVFEWLYNNNYDPENNWANTADATRLFRRLMDDERFYNEFIDRFAIYMGDFMNYKRTWETWEPMYNLIKDEYPYHRAQFNPWWPDYNQEINNAKAWLRSRTGKMYKQIDDYYHVGTPRNLSIKAVVGEGGYEIGDITFNGVRLRYDEFDGQYFAGRPITLAAENKVHWTLTVQSSAGTTVTEHDGNTLEFTIPADCTRVDVMASTGEVTMPEQPDTLTGKVIFDGEHQIDWWGQAILFEPETFPDFLEAKGIAVTLKLPNAGQESHFKFQTVNPDWSQTPLPSQATLPGSWSEGGDIHVIVKEDCQVYIPLNEDDKDLISRPGIQRLMLVGDNTIITEVLLVNETNSIGDVLAPEAEGQAYSIMGIPVGSDYKGFVIKNGRKYLQR